MCLWSRIFHDFCVKYRKKFLLNNDITNYLKSVFSLIGKKYFCWVWFMLLIVTFIYFRWWWTKIFPCKGDANCKKYYCKKIFKEYSKIKKQICDDEVWIEGSYILNQDWSWCFSPKAWRPSIFMLCTINNSIFPKSLSAQLITFISF